MSRTDGQDRSNTITPLGHLRPGQPITPAVLVAHGDRAYEPPTILPQRHLGIGTQRKIAIIGSAPTIDQTPWFDPSWEIWAHATIHTLCRRVDRYFDLHPWSWIESKGSPGYLSWLKREKAPIFLAELRQEVPSSVRYPLDRILSEFPRYFTSHTAYMVALALTEGVSHLGFFGIHYQLGSEYAEQRAGAEFWAGIAAGRGVQLVIPPTSPLCHEPKELYAYESHAEGEPAKKRKARKHADRVDAKIDGLHLRVGLTIEESERTAHPGVEMAKDLVNMRRMMEGKPAVLPNGEPAW